MDASAFEADIDDQSALNALYESVPEDVKAVIRVIAFVTTCLAKLCLIVFAVTGCAAAFALLIGWVCIFWVQTQLLLKLSSILRVVYEVPQHAVIGSNDDEGGNFTEKHREDPESARLATRHTDENDIFASHRNDTPFSNHSAAEMDMFEDFLNSPKDTREASSSLTAMVTSCTGFECGGEDHSDMSAQAEDARNLLDEATLREDEELQVAVTDDGYQRRQDDPDGDDETIYSNEEVDPVTAPTNLLATSQEEEDQLNVQTLREIDRVEDRAKENKGHHPHANASSVASKRAAEQTAWLARLQSSKADAAYSRFSRTASTSTNGAPRVRQPPSATANKESLKRASALGFSEDQVGEAANFAGGATRGGSKRNKPPSHNTSADRRNTHIHSLYNSRALGREAPSQQDLPSHQASGESRLAVPATTNATASHTLEKHAELAHSQSGTLPPHLRKKLAAQASRETAEGEAKDDLPSGRRSGTTAKAPFQAHPTGNNHISSTSMSLLDSKQRSSRETEELFLPPEQRAFTDQIQQLKSFNTGKSQQIDPRFLQAHDIILGFSTDPVRIAQQRPAIPPGWASPTDPSKSVDKPADDACQPTPIDNAPSIQLTNDFGLPGGDVMGKEPSTVDSGSPPSPELRSSDAGAAAPCDDVHTLPADTSSGAPTMVPAGSPVIAVSDTPIEATSDVIDTATRAGDEAKASTKALHNLSASSGQSTGSGSQDNVAVDVSNTEEDSKSRASPDRKAALQQAVDALNQQAHRKSASLGTLTSFLNPASASASLKVPSIKISEPPVALQPDHRHPDLQDIHFATSTPSVTPFSSPTPGKQASSLSAKAPSFFAPSPKKNDEAADSMADKNIPLPIVPRSLSREVPLPGSQAYAFPSSYPTWDMSFPHQNPELRQNVNHQPWPQSSSTDQSYREDFGFGYLWDPRHAGIDSNTQTSLGMMPGLQMYRSASTNRAVFASHRSDILQDAQLGNRTSSNVLHPGDLHRQAHSSPSASYEQSFPALPTAAKEAAGSTSPRPPGLAKTGVTQETFDKLLPDSELHVDTAENEIGDKAIETMSGRAGKKESAQVTPTKPLEQTLPQSTLSNSIDQRFRFTPGAGSSFGTKDVDKDVATKNSTFLLDFQDPSPKLDDADRTKGSDHTFEEIDNENDDSVTLEQDADDRLETTAETISKPSLKKKRKAARGALIDAWVKREEVRGRQVGLWTLDGARALEDATKAYNSKRAELAKKMATGELSEQDTTTFPLFSMTDLSRPKRARILQDAMKKDELADVKVIPRPKSTVDTSVERPKASVDLKELQRAALEARGRYQEAYAYFSRPPPQGRAHLRDLKLKGEKRIELAAKVYQKKVDELEVACPQGLPSWLAKELWSYNDEAEKKERQAWGF